MRIFFLSRLTWILYRLLTWSWRVQLVESPSLLSALKQGRCVIFAHWHGHELCIVHLVTRYRIATMTSTSHDGQIIDYVIKQLKGATVKGSSTRGAVGALKGLVRLCRSGRNASMAVDGPKGPIYVVKPGVFELAHLTNALIVPMGVCAKNFLLFKKSWNKAFLPLPFSKLVIYIGEGMDIANCENLKAPELAETLATKLHSSAELARQQLFC